MVAPQWVLYTRLARVGSYMRSQKLVHLWGQTYTGNGKDWSF